MTLHADFFSTNNELRHHPRGVLLIAIISVYLCLCLSDPDGFRYLKKVTDNTKQKQSPRVGQRTKTTRVKWLSHMWRESRKEYTE